MSKRELAFSTFLKLLELDDSKRAAMLRGFLRGGGYNYWRPVQRLAREVASGEMSLLEMEDAVDGMCKGHQRKYNKKALGALLSWAGRRELRTQTAVGRIVVPFGRAGLSVRIEPELQFRIGDQLYLMHIWATSTPPLSEDVLSMGLYLFRKVVRAEHPNLEAQFLIFDAVKDRTFSEIDIFGRAEDMLKVQRTELSDLWRETTGRRETINRKKAPADRVQPKKGIE